MVSLSDFLENVQAIADARPAYRLGDDGDNGYCDCIGLIIGAIRRSGGTWSGVHGTNYTVRNVVDYLMDTADGLTVGEMVFKSRDPGDKYYDLPDRYKQGDDLRDYYHVGVVMSVDPLRIVHCTSPGGIREDTKIGQWKHRAWCSLIADTQEETMTQQMIVTAKNGSSVNMRKGPSLTAALVRKIDIGQQVTVTGESGEWSKVVYGGNTGYIKTEFLTAPEAAGTDILSALYAAREAINDAIRQTGGV